MEKHPSDRICLGTRVVHEDPQGCQRPSMDPAGGMLQADPHTDRAEHETGLLYRRVHRAVDRGDENTNKRRRAKAAPHHLYKGALHHSGRRSLSEQQRWGQTMRVDDVTSRDDHEDRLKVKLITTAAAVRPARSKGKRKRSETGSRVPPADGGWRVSADGMAMIKSVRSHLVRKPREDGEAQGRRCSIRGDSCSRRRPPTVVCLIVVSTCSFGSGLTCTALPWHSCRWDAQHVRQPVRRNRILRPGRHSTGGRVLHRLSGACPPHLRIPEGGHPAVHCGSHAGGDTCLRPSPTHRHRWVVRRRVVPETGPCVGITLTPLGVRPRPGAYTHANPPSRRRHGHPTAAKLSAMHHDHRRSLLQSSKRRISPSNLMSFPLHRFLPDSLTPTRRLTRCGRSLQCKGLLISVRSSNAPPLPHS